jgi:hypothetical protein
MNDEDYDAARGILLALVLGACLWSLVAVALAVWS